MKKILLFLSLVFSFVGCFSLVACSPNTPEHQHSYSTQRTEASCIQDGEVVYTCACGHTYNEPLSATGHQNIQYSDRVEPTCVETGTKECWYCADCNESWKDEQRTTTISDAEKVIQAIDHSYTATFTWNGYESAVVTISCTEGCNFTENFNANVENYTLAYASCTQDGLALCKATYVFEGNTYTDEKEKTIPAYTHDYSEPTWEWTGVDSATAMFVCSRDSGHTQIITATIKGQETIPPTCSSLGQTTYTATVVFGDKTYTDTVERYDIETIGHTYELDQSSWSWRSHTASDQIADYASIYTAKVTLRCSGDDCNSYMEKDATVTAQMTKPVLCTSSGEATYTASYIHNEKTYTATKVKTISHVGHKYAESNLCLNCDWVNLDLTPSVQDGVEYLWANGISIATSTMTKMIIPASYLDKPIKVSGFGRSNSRITEIEIQEGVEYVSLNSLANSGWDNLTTIYIPSTIKTLSFYYYNADKIATFCNEYQNGYYLGTKGNPYFALITVKDTSITNLNIHDETVMICETALGYDNSSIEFNALTSITIGSALKEIPSKLFTKCKALESISVSTNNPYFATSCGIVYDKAFTQILAIPTKISGEVVIPDSVKVIPAKAFANSLITSLNTGNGVVTVEGGVGQNCANLTSLILGNSVQSVGAKNDLAFTSCKNLSYISVGENVTEFNTTIYYKAATKSKPEEVSLKTLNVENVKNFVETNVFGMGFVSQYKNVTFMVNNQVTDTLVVPEGITEYNVNIKRFDIMHVYLPSTLKKIASQAFHTNTALITVSIPLGVTEIGAGAFAGCYSTNVYCEAPEKPAGWDSDWNRDINNGGPTVFWNSPNNKDVSEGGYCVIVKDNIRYQIDKENKTATFITQSSALKGDENGVFTIPTQFNYEGAIYTVTKANSSTINSAYIKTVVISKNLSLTTDMPVGIKVKIIFLGTEQEFCTAIDVSYGSYYHNYIISNYDIEFAPVS